MLNFARADLISIDQTTALICAFVLTRATASFLVNGVNEISACVLRITDVGTRMTNCDVINIRNIIITSEGTILDTGN